MVSCNWETVERLSALHELRQVPLVCTHPCTGIPKFPLHSHLKNLHMFSFRMDVISQVPKLPFVLKLKLQISVTSTISSICERSAQGDGTLEERTAGRKAHTGTSCILGCHKSHLQHWHLSAPMQNQHCKGSHAKQCQAMPAL